MQLKQEIVQHELDKNLINLDKNKKDHFHDSKIMSIKSRILIAFPSHDTNQLSDDNHKLLARINSASHASSSSK